MNKLKFVEFIRKPSQLTSDDLGELKQVVAEYPYFQDARIILAKASKLKDDPDTKAKIASASVYSTNRALLKKYINDELIFLRSLTAEESVSNTKKKPVSEVVKPKAEPVVEKEPEEEKIMQPENQVEFDIPEEEVEEQPKVEATPKEPEIDRTPLVPEPIVDEEPSSLDELIDALWKDVEQMRKSKARFLEIEKKIEEEDAVDEALKKATKKTEDTKPKPATTKSASDKAETAKAKKSTTSTSSSSKSAVKKTTAKKSTKTSSKKDDGGETKSEKKEDKGDPRSSQNSIIDDFIKINPTMPPMAKDKEAKPGDLSGDSTEFPHDLASEYLAEIFLEQGRTERAIQIYELLIEKYPEKSVYFADIIKKLNEQN